MKPISKQVKILLASGVFAISGYLLWNSVFGVKVVDPELQREAELNSPECNYEQGEIDENRIYTQKELDQAKACIEAVIKYLKNKEAEEG